MLGMCQIYIHATRYFVLPCTPRHDVSDLYSCFVRTKFLRNYTMLMLIKSVTYANKMVAANVY
jgi:hypothetical protein